jgi:hypothetical protein
MSAPATRAAFPAAVASASGPSGGARDESFRRADHVVNQIEGRASGPWSLSQVANRRCRHLDLGFLALKRVVHEILDGHRHHAEKLDHIRAAERFRPESDAK